MHIWGGVQGRAGEAEMEEGREIANVQEAAITRNGTGHTESIMVYALYICCLT